MYPINLLNRVKNVAWRSVPLKKEPTHVIGNLNQIIRKNLVGSFMVKGVGVMVNLALIPLGIHFLDQERFGVWVIINSLLAWLTFFDLGLGNGMRNKITQAFQRKRVKEARQLISTGYTSIFIATLIAFLAFWVLSRFVNWSSVFNVSSQLNPELSQVIMWSVSLFLLQIILKNVGVVMLSLQLTAMNNSLLVLSNILALAIIFSWQYFQVPASLLMYAICICGTPIVVYLVASIVFFYGRFAFLRPGIFRFSYTSLKDIGGLGIKFFVIQVAGMLLYQGNNIFVTQYFGPEEVTRYNVSYRYFNFVIMGFSILLTPFWPAFTKAYTQGNMDWIKSILQKFRRLWYVSVIAVIAMIITAKFVYGIWIGDKVQVSTDMNIANGLFAIIYTWNSINMYFLNGTGKIRLQYILTLVVLVLYVPLTMMFLHFYEYPSIIIFTNCLIQLMFSVFCYLQVDKILNQKVYGIWSR